MSPARQTAGAREAPSTGATLLRNARGSRWNRSCWRPPDCLDGGVASCLHLTQSSHRASCHRMEGCTRSDRLKLASDGSKRSNLLLWLRTGCAGHQTRDDVRLMHVEATTLLDDRFRGHLSKREGDRCAAGIVGNCYTCFPFPGATKGGMCGAGQSIYRGWSHRRSSTSSDRRRHGLARATPRTIFTPGGAASEVDPAALLVCLAQKSPRSAMPWSTSTVTSFAIILSLRSTSLSS